MKLVIPQLQPFCQRAEPISWALVRITAGLMLIPHGWPKLMAGIGPVAANALAKRGIQPAEPLAVILIAIETVGGDDRDGGDRLPPPAEVRLDRARLRISAVLGPGDARHRAARRRPVLASIAGSARNPELL
jgi:hypothetical protein